jgi:hypothetical protein
LFCAVLVLIIVVGLIFHNPLASQSNQAQQSQTVGQPGNLVFVDLQASVDATKRQTGTENGPVPNGGYNYTPSTNSTPGSNNGQSNTAPGSNNSPGNQSVGLQRIFNWTYGQQNHTAVITVDPKLKDEYQSEPQNNSTFETYLKIKPQDSSLKSLCRQFRAIAKNNNYNSDQLAQLAMAFVQKIRYGYASAAAMTRNQVDYLTPYEVLYNQEGVCLDKSILGVAILRELGFGSALFIYKKPASFALTGAGHAAIGIQCPVGSGLYPGDNYIYVESTLDAPIGVIPEMDGSGHFFVNRQNENYSNAWHLGPVDIYSRSYGNVFQTLAGKKPSARVA